MKTFGAGLLAGMLALAGAALLLPPTRVAAQTCGVSIGVASVPATVQVGSRGVVTFTLDGPTPITRVQVLLDTTVAGEVDGAELRDMAALRFSVPRTAAVYNLSLRTTDASGCVTTTQLPHPVPVVDVLPPPPTMSCPTAQAIASSTTTGIGLYTIPTAGGVAPVTVTCTPASGTAFTGGPTTVACRATDAQGRSASCVFPVTVQTVTPSTTPLTLVCPAGITTTPAGATTFAIPTPTGGVSPYLSFCDHRPTDPFPLGATTVACQASDFNGTTGACSFTVTVTAAHE